MLKTLQYVVMYVVSVFLITITVEAQNKTKFDEHIQLFAEAYGIPYALSNRYHDATEMIHEADFEDLDQELINLYNLLYKVIQVNLRMHSAEKKLREQFGKMETQWLMSYQPKLPDSLREHRDEIEGALRQVEYVDRFWRIMFEPYTRATSAEFCATRDEIDLCLQLSDHSQTLFGVTIASQARLMTVYRWLKRFS